jgi:hypothetical protein
MISEKNLTADCAENADWETSRAESCSGGCVNHRIQKTDARRDEHLYNFVGATDRDGR